MFQTLTRPSFLLLSIAVWLFGASPLFAAFGLSTSTDFYTVDSGAGLVFKIRRTDNGSSTQSPGDLASIVWNGVEYQNQSKGSHINSGFDFLYTGISAVSVSAVVVNTNFIRITVTAGDLMHYYMARNGYPHITMATHFTSELDAVGGLCRYIVRIPSALLPNGPAPSDIRGNTGAIESGDIFGMADGTTRSKHYSNMRLKDWSSIGATGTNVGVWMLRSNHEGDSGGPFYRSLLNQCGDDQEITYIINYGEAQTEPFRTNILNGPYTLAFTTGAAPATPDTSWVSTMGLTGFVGATGRGTVAGAGITQRDTANVYTVGFANAQAQYWCDAAASNGAFTCAGMLAGTYAMTVYKKEYAVYSANVTVTAGATTSLGNIAIANDPSRTVPLWRIGNWDGTPQEFRNGDKVTTMHPSDVRMASWNPGTFVVGPSSAATGIPAYQWKDVNGSQVIQFQLTAAQLVASTVRVGITCAFEGARPKISVNAWTSANPAPSAQPDTRTLTVGTYRGNNAMFSFDVPASAFVAGANTLTLFPISGSGATGFLSAGYSLDAIDVFQGTAQTLALPVAPASLDAIDDDRSAVMKWAAVSGAASYTVMRAPASGGPYETVASGVTGTQFTDTGLANGTTYFYAVSAVNTSGAGLLSPEASVTPGPLFPVAHLRFDEASGATAADSSGNGWNGALAGAVAFVAGTRGNAVSLPGASTDRVTLPTGVVAGLSNCTYAAWVKPNAVADWARVFDFGTGTTNYLFLTPRNGVTGRARFVIRTPAVAEQFIDAPAPLAAGVWTHVAVTLSGSTGTLYINGAVAGTNTAMTLNPASLGSTTQNFIGDSQFAADPAFNGLVDDFRIYKRALSAAEIAAFQTTLGTPQNVTATPGAGSATLQWSAVANASRYTVRRGGLIVAHPATNSFTDAGLTDGATYQYTVAAENAVEESADSAAVAVIPFTLRVHLKFDEASGATASDSGGNGYHAGLVNAPAFGAGRIGNALTFAGASSQYATLPAGVVADVGDCTIMTWVKITSLATWQRVFDFGTGATNYMFLTTQYSTTTSPNRLRFAIRTPSTGEQIINSSVTTPAAGTWAHVAITFSGATARMFLDGVEIGSNAAMTLTPASLGTTTLNYLGKSQFADPYLNAALDDFRIYTRAFSAAEIAALASPSAAWRLQHFGSMADSGNAAEPADPDRDGLTNRWEYFHGTNPGTFTSAPLTAQLVANRARLTFPRNTAATDLLARIQAADSLAGPWIDLAESSAGAPFTPLVAGVAVSESGAGATRTVTFTDLYTSTDPAHPQRFFRLTSQPQ